MSQSLYDLGMQVRWIYHCRSLAKSHPRNMDSHGTDVCFDDGSECRRKRCIGVLYRTKPSDVAELAQDLPQRNLIVAPRSVLDNVGEILRHCKLGIRPDPRPESALILVVVARCWAKAFQPDILQRKAPQQLSQSRLQTAYRRQRLARVLTIVTIDEPVDV
jgi:hypothetical protein